MTFIAGLCLGPLLGAVVTILCKYIGAAILAVNSELRRVA